MPVVPITLSLDVSSLQSGINVAKQQAAAVDNAVVGTTQKISMAWAYFNQIASISLSLVSRAVEGTAAQATVSGIVSGLQIAQAEVAIYQTLVQAAAFGTAGQFGRAAVLLGLAALMQTSVFAMMINKNKMKIAQTAAEDLAQQMEAYRS